MSIEWTPPEDFTSPPIDKPDVWIAKMAEVVRSVRGLFITDAKVTIWCADDKHFSDDPGYLNREDLFKGKDCVTLNLTFETTDGQMVDYSFGELTGLNCSIWSEEIKNELPFSEFQSRVQQAIRMLDPEFSETDGFINSERAFNLRGSQFEWLIGTSIEKVEMIMWKENPAYPLGVVIHFSNGKLLSICGWEGDEWDLLPYYEKPGWIEWEDSLERLV